MKKVGIIGAGQMGSGIAHVMAQYGFDVVLFDRTQEILDKYDMILLPTTPGTAFKFGENSADPIKMYLEDIFTVQANLTGMPAISLPIGKHSNGLPFGVQLVGRKFEESKMFSFSKYLMNSF